MRSDSTTSREGTQDVSLLLADRSNLLLTLSNTCMNYSLLPDHELVLSQSGAEASLRCAWVSRSGWSKHGGFELFLLDCAQGNRLWDIVQEAGEPWQIDPGAPSDVEGVERNLLAYGIDTDERTNPFEVRLENHVDPDLPDEAVGIRALRAMGNRGVARHQLGVVLDGAEPLSIKGSRPPVVSACEHAGNLTTVVWSYRMGRNIVLALISTDYEPGHGVEVLTDSGQVPGTLTPLPFLI